MDSRIILSQADFSANNIGRYIDLSDLTKAVLAKQTKYDQHSDEASALNLFLMNLTEGGFIGGLSPKLTVLMLPCLADVKAELFFNIASLDADGYPVDWSPTDMSNYVKTNKGVYVNNSIYNTEDNGFGFKLASSDFFTASSRPAGFSAIQYLYDANMTASNLQSRYIMVSSLGLVIEFSGLNANISSGGNNITSTLNTTKSVNAKGFYGMSFIPGSTGTEDNVLVNMCGDTTATITRSGTVKTASTVNLLNNNCILIAGNSNDTARPHSSLVAFGHSLTAEELASLKTLTDTLMASLNI